MSAKTAAKKVKKDPPLAASPVDSITVSLEVPVPQEKLFAVVSDPFQLPNWADPIKGVIKGENGEKNSVDYQLPNGRVSCPCDERVDAKKGEADFVVHIPGSTPLKVFMRTAAKGKTTSVFTLTLVSPPFSQHRSKNARAVMEKNLNRDLERLRDLVTK